MRPLLLLALALTALLSFTDSSPGAWRAGHYMPTREPVFPTMLMVAPVSVPADGWHQDTTGDTGAPCWIEWHSGRMTRAYVPKVDGFRIWIEGQWYAASIPADLPEFVRPKSATQPAKPECCPCCGCKCPCKSGRPCGKPNCQCVAAGGRVEQVNGETILNFGVNLDRIHQDRQERYWIDGPKGKRQITRDEAVRKLAPQAAAADPRIPDDSQKDRLTIIGSDQERQAIVQDWKTHPAFAGLRDKAILWDVPPDHWSLKDNSTKKPMYITTGHPTIYYQKFDGQVLFRQDAYAGPEATAAAIYRGIRQVDPNRPYDPNKDPDGRPKPPPAPGPSSPFPFDNLQSHHYILAAAALGAFLLLRKKA